jgi:hypothetical protein
MGDAAAAAAADATLLVVPLRDAEVTRPELVPTFKEVDG